ncbi:MAG TPA: zinc-binding alcohol dehydrogenase, partial [Xanthobacteraceae bacterium]|nr:zinc-binding alcohol dehydrogenase [Xanthobacteraceae bacterium]
MPEGRNQQQAEALWYVASGRAEVRQEPVAAPGPREVQVRALHSALSRGTEALVFAARVPATEFERMRPPFMAGAFPFPVKYGYAVVGRVEKGPPDLLGRNVFALHPHQTLFTIPGEAALLLPNGVPPQRGVLAANMETALNAVWDAAPGPADRIAVVGAGVVGSLVAWLCAQLAGAEVTLIDIEPKRKELAHALGTRFALPDAATVECDVVFHASGSSSGLATALRLAGQEATVVELSWYGDGEIPVALGGSFHSRRLRLLSSQVGHVALSHRPRWTHGRRLAAALSLLADARLDALVAP